MLSHCRVRSPPTQSFVRFNELIEFDLLDLPSKWTGEWVSRRFVEGPKTLRLIPMKGAPRGFANAWPAYAYEFEDLIGQAEQREALEQGGCAYRDSRAPVPWDR
jgi:hypothetical protein